MSRDNTRFRSCRLCGQRTHLDSMRVHVGGADCLLTLVSVRGGRFADNTRGPRVLLALQALSDALGGRPESPALAELEQEAKPA